MRGAPVGWLDRLAAVVEEASLNLWRRRPVALATSFAIGTLLFFPGAASIALSWLEQAVVDAERRNQVTVYFVEGVSESQAEAARALAAASADAAELVSPGEARRRFLVRHPELGEAVAGLTPEDLDFPRTLEIRGASAPGPLGRRLAGLSGVEEVRHDAEWSGRLHGLKLRIRTLRSAVGVLALGLVGAGIGSVIRIAALARREELAIMRLVGAPRFHVRAPFMVEGLVQGACGGAFAGLLLLVACRTTSEQAAALLPAASHGIPATTLAWLIAGPAVAGLLGAAAAVESVLRRHAGLER